MNFTEEEKEFFMKKALKEAQKAAENEEVPIGVVIVKDGEIIARDFNRRELDGRATHHAEVCACLLYTSPSPRDAEEYRMPSSA